MIIERYIVVYLSHFFLQKSFSEEGNDFHQIILRVLNKEVIPEFKVLQDLEAAPAGSNFSKILQEAVNTLCKNLSWTRSLTTKQKFCWGLVSSCCSRLNISRDSLDWVHSYDKVLKQVGYIFNVYCNGRKLTESRCVMIEKLPDEIANHQVEEIKR